MARTPSDAAVTISVLDRLIDQDPRTPDEPPQTRLQSVRQLREAVRRDLEWLLNTRRVAVPPPPELRELNRSVYAFGLPDFSGFSSASPADQASLIRQLQSTVKLFEPRLTNIRVLLLEPGTRSVGKLRFRIDGMLLMDPAPEHISFDTVLELNSGEYEVGNAG